MAKMFYMGCYCCDQLEVHKKTKFGVPLCVRCWELIVNRRTLIK